MPCLLQSAYAMPNFLQRTRCQTLCRRPLRTQYPIAAKCSGLSFSFQLRFQLRLTVLVCLLSFFSIVTNATCSDRMASAANRKAMAIGALAKFRRNTLLPKFQLLPTVTLPALDRCTELLDYTPPTGPDDWYAP